MEYVLAALVAMAAVAIVIAPLFAAARRGGVDRSEATPLGPDALEAERQAIYREISELQFDQRMGKLPVDEFEHLREELLARAALLIAEADRRRAALEAGIEQAIADVRRARTDGRLPGTQPVRPPK